MDKQFLFTLLAGGQSSRMGQDKGALIFEGQTVTERIMQNAQTLFEHTIIADNQTLADYCTTPFQGPLSGLAAGLAQAKTLGLQGIVCFTCDTLILPSQLLPLMSEHSPNLCFSQNQKMLPLLGRFSVDVLDDLEQYLNCGERRVIPFIKQQNPQIIELPAPFNRFASYNTLEQFEQAKTAYQSAIEQNLL